jgi:uncharacterized protein (DUF1697 family)
MNTYISMLRGINVSGQKKIRMADLQKLFETSGLANVQTYLQSGNVVFDSPEPDTARLRERIEAQIEAAFGYQVSVFIRDAEDFRRIIAGNPFLSQRNEDPDKLHVTFLNRAPSPAAWDASKAPESETDEFARGEKEIYLFCPNGYGRSKLSNSFFERKLGMPATTRNWRTVNALYEMAKIM